MSAWPIRRDWVWACFTAALITAALFPTICLLTASPMITGGWTLRDPTVSATVFVPGIDLIRFEIATNGNWLWSSLRNLGAPILANEVQAGPLFPLTLALIWIPDPYFWTALVLARVFLIGTGAMLIARDVLKFDRLPAIIFTLVFAYSFYVCRWLNHPWQNGFLVGLWLLYFGWRGIGLARYPWGRRRFVNTALIAFLAYSLVTCGFPEASAMSALLIVLVIVPKLIAVASEDPRTIARYMADCLFGIATGIMLAGAQIFALAEELSISNEPVRRAVFGFDQHGPGEIFRMIMRFQEDIPTHAVIHIFGLVTVALFLLGLTSRMRSIRSWSLVDAIAISTLGFYVLKVFPVWPAFNVAIGSIPILKDSIFPFYFCTIGLFGVGILCAHGVALVDSAIRRHRLPSLFWAVAAAIALTVALALAAGSTSQDIDVPRVVWAAAVLSGFPLVVIIFTWLPNGRTAGALCGLAIAGLLIAEAFLNRPMKYVSYTAGYFQSEAIRLALGDELIKGAAAIPLSRYDLREPSENGHYIRNGIGTIDNPDSAILTHRAALFRTEFFNSPWGAVGPLRGEGIADAYRLAGANVAIGAEDDVRPSDLFVPLARHGSYSAFLDRSSPGRAFLAGRCHSATDEAQAAALIKGQTGFRLGDVVAEGLDAAQLAQCRQLDRAAWQPVAIEEDRGPRVRLRWVQGPAVLTLNDSYYPGWRATDMATGTALAITPANVNFRAVFLPEARPYRVEFRYRPPWLVYAQLLAGAAILLWLGLALFTFREAWREAARSGADRIIKVNAPPRRFPAGADRLPR